MKKGQTIICGIVLSMVMCVISSSLEAAPRRDWRSMRHHPHYGKVVVFKKPPLKIVYGAQDYYWVDGVFYRQYGSHYVVIDAPIGAVVRYLPSSTKQISVGGVNYYYYNDVYYIRYLDGYQVVANPVYAVSALPKDATVIHQTATKDPVVGSPSVLSSKQKEFVVNVPNQEGSYIPVTIQRSGEGFIGPQGEFYKDFPKVEQLCVMYGN